MTLLCATIIIYLICYYNLPCVTIGSYCVVLWYNVCVTVTLLCVTMIYLTCYYVVTMSYYDITSLLLRSYSVLLCGNIIVHDGRSDPKHAVGRASFYLRWGERPSSRLEIAPQSYRPFSRALCEPGCRKEFSFASFYLPLPLSSPFPLPPAVQPGLA